MHCRIFLLISCNSNNTTSPVAPLNTTNSFLVNNYNGKPVTANVTVTEYGLTNGTHTTNSEDVNVYIIINKDDETKYLIDYFYASDLHLCKAFLLSSLFIDNNGLNFVSDANYNADTRNITLFHIPDYTSLIHRRFQGVY